MIPRLTNLQGHADHVTAMRLNLLRLCFCLGLVQGFSHGHCVLRSGMQAEQRSQGQLKQLHMVWSKQCIRPSVVSNRFVQHHIGVCKSTHHREASSPDVLEVLLAP